MATMQVSEASRDRLRALGRPGATLEATLVHALEREQFGAPAEAAAARRSAMTAEEQAAVAVMRPTRSDGSTRCEPVGGRHLPR